MAIIRTRVSSSRCGNCFQHLQTDVDVGFLPPIPSIRTEPSHCPSCGVRIESSRVIVWDAGLASKIKCLGVAVIGAILDLPFILLVSVWLTWVVFDATLEELKERHAGLVSMIRIGLPMSLFCVSIAVRLRRVISKAMLWFTSHWRGPT